MQKILKGNQIQLFYQGKTFAYATAHTLTITGDTASVASKDHGEWDASSVSNLSWEVTGDYFYTDLDYDTLFDLMLYKRPILVQVAEVGNYSENGLVDLGGDVAQWVPASKCKQGYASITSLALNANTGEKATYSLTLTGSGPLTKYDLSDLPYKINVSYDHLTDPETGEGVELFNMRAKNNIVVARVFDEGSSVGTLLDLGDSNVYPLDSEPENGYIEFTVFGNSVPEYMFYQNSHIRAAHMPYHISTIEEYAFADTRITTMEYECETMKIMHDSFNECSYLDSINKSRDINYLQSRQIGASAFSSCVRLTNVNVGDACKDVGIYAFSENQLSSVYFGHETHTIGEGAFSRGGMQTTLKAYFNSENAPNLNGSNALGTPAMLEVHLLNADSAKDWTRNFTINGWDAYDPAEGTAYIIGS